jgi:hypothetical protein
MEIYVMSQKESFESLWAYCMANNRLVPVPIEWAALHQKLAISETGPAPRRALLPLILAAWHHTMPIDKLLRFKHHIEWARDHQQLNEIGDFLRSLPEQKWVHFGEI